MSDIKLDPVKYEIFYNMIEQALIEAKNTVRYLAGSAIVREGGEVGEGLYLPNGDTVNMAAGLLMHIQSSARSIKYINEQNYADDIGIYEGDQFINNDAHIGGQHLPDMQVVAPVFYKDKLVGWVGNFGHVPEIGGIEPGSVSSRATSFYHEGICFPCVKIVERGKIRRDTIQMMTRMSRDPRIIDIDTRAKIAGNERAIKGIVKIIDDFGLDFYMAATQKLVEDGEAHARAKVKTLRPGIYSSRMYADTTGPVEKLGVIQLDMEITEDGDIILNTPIVSPEREGFLNCALPAIEGLVFAVLQSQIFYKSRWNSGNLRVLKLNIPKGSWINAHKEAAVAYCPTGVGMLCMAAVTESMSRASYVAGIYEDIMCACPLMPALYYGGIDQYGRSCAGLISDACTLGGGARHEKDGLDSSVTQWNPWTAIGDVESLEMPQPLLYLGRRHVIDSGGFGKYRGGAGAQGVFVLHGSPFLGVGGIGSGTHVSGTPGIFGGYSAAVARNDIIRNTDYKERVKEQKPLPHRVIDFDDPQCIKGKHQALFTCFPIQPMKEGDMIGIHYLGGGGSGDCLERDPNIIVQDIKNELTSLRTAREIYCVAIDPLTLQIDHEKTEEMRQARRRERLSKGIPAKQYVKQMVEKRKTRKLPPVVLEFLDEMMNFSSQFVETMDFEEKVAMGITFSCGDLSGFTEKPVEEVVLKKEILNLTPYVKIMEDDEGKKVAVCSKCEYQYCDAQENFKLYSLIYERDPKEIQPGRLGPDGDWMIYREFYCPGCGTQIEVEAVPPGIPILHNVKLKL